MPDDVVTMDKIVVAVQAPRPDLPRLRDLRRHRQHLRLRALRRAAQAQRRRRLVAGDDRRARRHRRAGLGDHPAPAHVGGLRPPRRLHRPARRLPDVQAALPRRPPRRRARRPLPAQAEQSCPARGRSATSPRRASSTSCSRRRSAPSRRPARPSTCAPRRRRASSWTSRPSCSFARRKPPFGIAQVGKSFRNEITPGNFIFRTLEFEQMEMEFFVPPDEAERVVRALAAGALRLVRAASASAPTTCACASTTPTSSATTRARTGDVEYLFPIGWSGARGHRQPRRLRPHPARRSTRARRSSTSTSDGRALRPARHRAGRRRRARDARASSCDAYDEEELGGEARTVLKLHPRLAPVKVAVLPLVRKDGQPELAHEVRNLLRARMQTEYDEGGSIGKPLPPPGRDRHAVVRDDRPPVARGPHGHGARPRHARPGARRDRRARRPARRRLAAPWTSPKLRARAVAPPTPRATGSSAWARAWPRRRGRRRRRGRGGRGRGRHGGRAPAARAARSGVVSVGAGVLSVDGVVVVVGVVVVDVVVSVLSVFVLVSDDVLRLTGTNVVRRDDDVTDLPRTSSELVRKTPAMTNATRPVADGGQDARARHAQPEAAPLGGRAVHAQLRGGRGGDRRGSGLLEVALAQPGAALGDGVVASGPRLAHGVDRPGGAVESLGDERDDHRGHRRTEEGAAAPQPPDDEGRGQRRGAGDHQRAHREAAGLGLLSVLGHVPTYSSAPRRAHDSSSEVSSGRGSLACPPVYQPGLVHSSKCRWQAVASPVRPTSPTFSPASTASPTDTSTALRCM